MPDTMPLRHGIRKLALTTAAYNSADTFLSALGHKPNVPLPIVLASAPRGVLFEWRWSHAKIVVTINSRGRLDAVFRGWGVLSDIDDRLRGSETASGRVAIWAEAMIVRFLGEGVDGAGQPERGE